MLYASSTTTRHNDFRSAKKDLLHQETSKQRSYSPQYSPKNDDDRYKATSMYSPKRDAEVSNVLSLFTYKLSEKGFYFKVYCFQLISGIECLFIYLFN